MIGVGGVCIVWGGVCVEVGGVEVGIGFEKDWYIIFKRLIERVIVGYYNLLK